jgi:DNA-directed RNA polymerase specialized sigma24 family protein
MLEVDFEKELYWKSCYDRDFKEPAPDNEVRCQEMNDALTKSMNALDEYSATLLALRNTHRAPDAEIAHMLEIPLDEVESEFKKAFELLVVEMKKNGLEITD